MGVKLYDQCWGVTRARQVVGPFGRNVNGDYLFGGYVYSEHGVFLRWEDGGLDLIRTFKSEAAARAWLNRKSWWRLPYWQGFFTGLGLASVVFGLSACTAPTRAYPHSPRCNEDGVHTHTTNGQSPEGE